MKPQIHEDLTRRAAVRMSSDRQFGLVVGIFLAAVALWPVLRHGSVREAVLGVAVVFLLAAVFTPYLLHPFNRAWTAVGAALARVVNPVAMAALFYLVFTPCGLLMRLMGKDPLRLQFDRRAATYWIERTPPGPPPETMTNQF
jgi:hypothetical protein